MKEEEFDKILKDNINEQIKAPEKLKNRIRQEIRQMDNKKKKTPLLLANNIETKKNKQTKVEKRKQKYYNHQYGVYKNTGTYRPY